MKKFFDYKNNQYLFYSGLSIINIAFLRKKINKINYNFEKEFFKSAFKTKKVFNFFSDRKFFDVNTEADLLQLKK